jgi:ElaB/YqjD/DUF883 family membrane-anchored ribosome-binding protein
MEDMAKRIRQQVDEVQEAYETGRKSASEFARAASDSSRKAVTLTDQWVHENPWVALGIVAGVGLLIGVLVSQATQSD